LRELGFIDFIVAVLAVTDQIDNDIGLPFLTPFSGEFANSDDGFGIITIDVEDRGVNSLMRTTQIAR
jgi:hypothetical protein